MSTTPERIEELLGQASELIPWTGFFDREVLREWLRLELGDATALDGWVKHGEVMTRAAALSPVLHVVSGNTPHAAFQSVLRGLLAGCRNRVKIPSAGLPEFEKWASGLNGILAGLVEIRSELPEEWLECEAAVIFGNAETMRYFRGKLPAETRRIEHGPKSSIAVIFQPCAEAAERVAEDVLRFEQRGCLSVQAIYVDGDDDVVSAFGDDLAEALAGYRAKNDRGAFSISDSGSVANARAMARYRGGRLWESAGSTDWTVVHERGRMDSAGPGNGFVRLGRWGIPPLVELAEVSTVAIWPFSEEHAERLAEFAPPRICQVGKAQEPTVFWHHDGMPTLASLVRWRDLG